MYIDEERGIVIVDHLFQITAKPVSEKEKKFIEYIKNINKRYEKGNKTENGCSGL